MTLSSYATPELCDHFERQCERFVNGGCTVRRCVVRGRDANRSGLAPMYTDGQASTCEAFEAAHIIADLIGRHYGPEYQTAPENAERAKREALNEARALGRLIGR